MEKATSFKRYTIQEWIALIVGAIIWGIQLYRYATNQLSEAALELPVFCIGFLLLFAPLTILNIIRKARGLDPK